MEFARQLGGAKTPVQNVRVGKKIDVEEPMCLETTVLRVAQRGVREWDRVPFGESDTDGAEFGVPSPRKIQDPKRDRAKANSPNFDSVHFHGL